MTRDRYHQIRRVGYITAWVHIVLGFAKVGFGSWGHSQALVADGLHSFADLLTDLLVIVAARLGSSHADQDHPYGHERIETAFAVGLSLLLLIVGLGIGVEAVYHLFYQHFFIKPANFVVLIALLSMLANEGLFRYGRYVAQRCHSPLLESNAWHCRSDAAASGVVLFGAVGAIAGLPWLDAVAALIVSVLIVKMAWDLGLPCLRELVDTGLDENHLALIKTLISETPGIEALHQLRTRMMANHVFVDVHVLVAPRLSVSEGHFLGEQVRRTLLIGVSAVKDVTVHVDPEDDESVPDNLDRLPTRPQLETIFSQIWCNLPGYDKINRLDLHYLNGQVTVEVFLPCEVASSCPARAALLAQYQSAASQITLLAGVTLFYY